MRTLSLVTFVLSLIIGLSSCSPKISTRKLNAYTTVNPNIVSYNELTMDIDEAPITYVIDISTEAGKTKLKNLSLDEACDLALIEAIMANWIFRRSPPSDSGHNHPIFQHGLTLCA